MLEWLNANYAATMGVSLRRERLSDISKTEGHHAVEEEKSREDFVTAFSIVASGRCGLSCFENSLYYFMIYDIANIRMRLSQI
jgi:hypothetical protein